MAIDELRYLVPPPSKPTELGTLDQWRRIEGELGIKLPTEYRDFVFSYGSGLFAGFYRVYNPFAASKHIALIPQIKIVCEMERQQKEEWGESQVPYAVFPEANGILPWGNDENGNYYFWLTNGSPNEWTVVQNAVRGSGYRGHDCTMTEFLTGVLKGEVEPLAGDYPQPQDMVFESWDACENGD